MTKPTVSSPHLAGKTGKPRSAPTEPAQETPQRPAAPYVGRPLDGSQYLEVVEEQEYADRRPSQEEQQPRFSYRETESQREADNSSRSRP
jgi:hypothetical protein